MCVVLDCDEPNWNFSIHHFKSKIKPELPTSREELTGARKVAGKANITTRLVGRRSVAWELPNPVKHVPPRPEKSPTKGTQEAGSFILFEPLCCTMKQFISSCIIQNLLAFDHDVQYFVG